MRSITFESRSMESAVSHAERELRVHRDYITLDTTEKKSMFGLKKTYTITATVDVDIAELGLKTLKAMFENMAIEATIEVDTTGDQDIAFIIDTKENPVLIGKNGKTLEALQFYLRNLLNIFTDSHKVILVDIGGYKDNRKKQLEILATKTAKEVAKTRVPVKLTPMNAYERRIIHTKLAEWRDVVTKSEGEGANRHLVITPKKR